jgi:hypothetical protein
MNTMIKYLKLPFCFDMARMKHEVSALTAQWVAHYNTNDYEGVWTALPLRSLGGRNDNAIADPRPGLTFEDTELLQLCPYLKQVVETLPCEKMAVRLLNLEAGAVIKEHRDRELCFESGEARIHVPVMTNEDVAFYLDGERVVMNEGECWYMNFNLKHRIYNNGTTNRIHLVMDCVVNDELRALFAGDDIEIKKEAPMPEKFSLHEKEAMIASLLAMNTPTSLQMAEEMRRELAG